MTSKTDRSVAIQTLIDILESGAYANIALRKTLSETDIDQRSRAFVTDLVNETLRNLIQIDYALNRYSKTSVDKMKPFIRNLLRISVCQIRFMDKIPDRAAVNEAVALAKQHGFVSLAGFVNAVLRNISREETGKIKSLSLKYSYPKWLMEKLHIWLGCEASVLEFCENSHQPPPVIVLANIHKTSQEALAALLLSDGVNVSPLENTSHPFLMLHHPGDITRLTAFSEGLFFVADPGIMLAVEAVNPAPGQVIIDMCAAPGGKSFAMAGLMQNTGKILAYDIHPHRVELINQTKKRLGFTNIHSEVRDATTFDPSLSSLADTVLVDAPCTGFGTIRKHPEIKYNRNQQDITQMAALQATILANAARYVKPGGKLVYCTCTITNEENTDNAKQFLQNHHNFHQTSEIQTQPSATSDAFYVTVLTKL